MSTPDCPKTRQTPIEVTFRPDFCSPDYLNGLLHLQHLHWLRITRRPADGTVSAFQFVIPTNQANLLCVLGTEMPQLRAELGFTLREVPVPEFVTPDGLKAFSVEYGEQLLRPAAAHAVHARFLAALSSICVRLQLTKLCLNPASGSYGGGCAACAKVRTHTKSVRGASVSRPRLRPPLALDLLARPRIGRAASAEPATMAAVTAGKVAAKAACAKRSLMVATTPELRAKAAADELSASAAKLILERLLVSMAADAADGAALLTAAASEALCVSSSSAATGGFWRRPAHWRQFGLEHRVAVLVSDAVLARQLVRDDVAEVFAGWAGELAGRLLAGGVRLVAAGVASAAVAGSRIADAIGGRLLCDLEDAVSAEMSTADQLVVRVSLPCDCQTGRSLLGLRPMSRRCPNCGSVIVAELVGPSGYRLTIRSLGRRCSRHAAMLQLADCARSSKEAALGGLLLQEVAALPACEKA